MVMNATTSGLGSALIVALSREDHAFITSVSRQSSAGSWSRGTSTSTTTLMKHLYRHLADGEDKGSALRDAKIDLLKEFGDQAVPFYWAGFTLVGEGSTAVFN